MRIPKASNEKAFQISAKNWIPHALKLNSGINTTNDDDDDGDDLHDATRRMVRYFIKKNKEAVITALEQEGMSVLRQMSEEQVVAMMMDGKVKTCDGPANIMRHLRNHCGKEFLPSVKKVEASLRKKMKDEKEADAKKKGKGGMEK